MNRYMKLAIIVGTGLILSLLPAPGGLSGEGWIYFSLFVAVFLGLILEPFPSAYIVLAGVAIACVLKVGPPPNINTNISSSEALAWGLSGFSNTTVWLIIIAFMFALGYEKTGLGKRISLVLVSRMGRRSLGLGYAIALADLFLAPFMPSNTARSGGTIFPIVKHIPTLYDSSPDKAPRKIGAYISWVAFAATCVTSSMFYTALATNVLAKSLVEDLGITAPTWIEWVRYFLPVGILLFSAVPLLTYLVYPPEIKSSDTIPRWAREELHKMGRISRKEILMACLGALALLLWIFGKYLDIHATLAALTVLCLMVLLNIINWRDILKNTPAWNVLIWFGAMVTLAGGLKNVGFLDWFATSITSAIARFSPDLMLVLLLLVFYFVHYLFASSTAHVTALLSIFLVTGSAIEGLNFPIYLYLLLYSLGLMGVLTPYATGASPIWYGLGYISTRAYWRLGAFFGLVFILALIFIGIPWMKIWL